MEPETPVPENAPVPPVGLGVAFNVTLLASTQRFATASIEAVGTGFTTTDAVPASLLQLPTFTTKLYVPSAASTAVIVGFCSVDVKLFGPVHWYVPTALVPKLILEPAQTGELVVIVGIVGGANVETTISFLVLSHPLTVCVTKYEISATAVVLGVGAMVDEVVLVAVEYHFKDVPVADNITAVSF